MKANPKPWLYGPNWQDIRCEARTRRGTLCQRPARLPVWRCKLHGGVPLDHGPRTALRDSQKPEQSMASSPKRSVQRPSERPSRGGRCAASWPFTPIVNPPEVAIMGLTRTEMQPIWNGEAFDPRPMVPLDLSYDHRVINGAEAARFMCHYAGLVSQPSRLVL